MEANGPPAVHYGQYYGDRNKPPENPTLRQAGFSQDNSVLQFSYDLVSEAAKLRKYRVALCKAEALDYAFDRRLTNALNGEWVRVGEVFRDKQDRLVKALCINVKED